MTIGGATGDDLRGLLEIFNHYALTANSNFDTTPTTLTEQRKWFRQFSDSGPHQLLVARQGDEVVGYAASSPYRNHKAFDATVEFGISLHPEHRGLGIGSLLYSSLLDRLASEPVHVVLAGIAIPNDPSVALHRKFGFTEVGTFAEYAIKHGEYISSLWMQRLL